jgi:hypothetical protein
MIDRTIKLEIREVTLPDGGSYFSLFDENGDKAAPWADSDSIEELLECLSCKPE